MIQADAEPRRVSTLLWDNDGVLVDTEELYFEATREVLAQVGVTLSSEQYRQLFLVDNRGAWHLAEARGVPADAIVELRALRHQRHEALLRERNSLMPGVQEVLCSLAPLFRMAIVTSSRRAHFEAVHREGTLLPYFELVLAREDYAFSKPDPEPYLLALRRLGVSADECLVIEDSERGLAAARAAGIRCWVVPSGLTRSFTFAQAERRFETLESLRDALLIERARSLG
jgi:HAD superfamily hydrolase (TIGR01509 family)